MTSTGTGTLALSSVSGLINLPTATNTLSATTALALSVTGSNAATFFNNAALQLGDTTLGTGTFTLTSNGSLTQKGGTTIEAGGAMSLTVTSNNRDILLGNVGNRIGGTVTVAESGAGFLRDVNLRNAADNASAPIGTPLTTAGDVRNLTLFFDNNGVALPGYNITGTLNVTAGGDITQTAAETIGGASTFTILGDHAINLSDPANAFASAVAFNAPQSTQPVLIADTTGLSLGTSNLGRGTFSATAVTGDITQSGSIVQEKGAAPATFTVTAGSTITLSNNTNRFTGGMVFAGAGLTTLSVRNADFMADFSDLTIPSSVNNLTVQFDNASAALPTLGSSVTPLASLSVTALGIVQQAGTSINATAATFTANAFPLDLSNAGNDFTDLTVNNSGRNDVTIRDIDDVNFAGTSALGTGRFTVNAGAITDTGTITQANVGPSSDVRFTSTGSVTLNSGHGFRGPVSVNVTGASTATIVNTGVALTLGSITTAAGAITATAGAQGIVQDPNSVLSLGGASSFTATGGGDITLNNSTNNFTGAVGLSGDVVSLRATGAVVLAPSVVNTLTIKSGGAAAHSITQTGAFTGGGDATFDAGAGNVIFTTATNDFDTVSVFSTGTSVAITDSGALRFGSAKLGGGTLSLVAGGSITSGGSIVQTNGTGAITLDTPAGSNVTLNNSGNVLRGAVNVLHATDVNLRSKTDVFFTPGSVVTGNLTATAGGDITLPGDLTQLDALTLSANSTTISSDVNTNATFGIDVTGSLTLIGNRSLTNTGSIIIFRNGVTVGGTLTLGVGAGGSVQVASGDWDQGSNDLTINGAGATLSIGGSGVASFNMTSGTISLPGGGNVDVAANATLRVGATAAAETVTLANGAGLLTINGSAALGVGFGATNDRLIKTGTGNINLATGALLLGSGVAGASASPVLVSQTALLTGRFANSVEADGAPRDFFAGSDIITPAYDFTQLTVKSGGVLAPSGTISGFLPDGDKYTVTSSLGASAGLAIAEDANGLLNVVVRNNTAAGSSTLSITTSGGGDGRLPIAGVMVHTPGAVSISAPAGDFTGRLTTAGTLASLVARDLGFASQFTLSGGGPATGKTSITAHEVNRAAISLPGVLDKFKAVSVASNTQLTADKFGTITTTGDVKGSNANTPGIPNPGDFLGKITSTTSANALVLSSATIAGTVGGTWDLRGSVGKVAVGKVSSWTLGTQASSTAKNGGLLTDVKSLSLGTVVTSMIMNATGMVRSITALDIGGSGHQMTAGSFGTVKVTGSLALGLVGNAASLTLTAMSNTGGVALKSLAVAGDVTASNFKFLDGDASSIAVARTMGSTVITATDINGHGNLKSITAGRWQSSNVDARTVGTLKVTGNFPAGLFGDFTGSTVTVRGNNNGIGLMTFDAQGNVSSSLFDIQHGNATTIKAGRTLGSTSVLLLDPLFGNLGTIQAGDWSSGVNVVAKTIGTVASVGAAATGPASPLLLGNIASDTITAYLNTGTAAAIGKLNVKGDLSSSTVDAEHGIGSATIGRSVSNSFIIADDAMTGALAVGRIATLTAGAWSASAVSVNTFGAVKITGFKLPESSSASFQFGDVMSGIFLAHGATPSKPTGIDSFSVARHVTSSSVVAPFGIKTLTVGGSVTSSQVIADHPTTPASGFLTSFAAGELDNATVRAGSIGTLKAAGSVPFALLGNVASSIIAITSGATIPGGLQTLGTFTAAGDFVNSVLDAPATVGKIEVLGAITTTGVSTRVQAGYAAGSKLGSLTAGAFGKAGSTFTTDLVAQSVGTFTLKGNAARGFTGTTDNAFIDILGNSGTSASALSPPPAPRATASSA